MILRSVVPHSRTAFHRLLEPLDRRVIARAVAAHGGDHGVGGGDRAWTCERHLKSLLFAQWAGLTSLRQVVAGLAAHSRSFYHLNLRAPCRSTLADANAERPAAVFRDIAMALIPVAAGRSLSPAPITTSPSICSPMTSSLRPSRSLYKERWDIELLFKWLKQNLKIRSFLGRSENAGRIQIYVALIAFMLLRILHHTAARAYQDSTALLLTHIKFTLFSPLNLCHSQTAPPKPPALRPASPQACFAFR
jgi:hypothetical protein